MCAQCQALEDEDDLDALAAAFVLRQGKAVSIRPLPAPPALAGRGAAGAKSQKAAQPGAGK